jgi:hypothetical protein
MDRFAVPGLAQLETENDIGLVLAFLNTCDAESGEDLLDTAEKWGIWCTDQHLGPPSAIEPAREVRDALRSSVMIGQTAPVALVRNWPIQVSLRDGIPVLAGTDAVGAILTSAVHLATTGHWDRIKICPAEDCLWAFYDRSRNKSRTWCSMRVCGNREKARSWRERHTTTSAS